MFDRHSEHVFLQREISADTTRSCRAPSPTPEPARAAAQTLAGEGLVFSVVEKGVWFSLLPRGCMMSVQATQREYFLSVR